jgi:hypothetical protein
MSEIDDRRQAVFWKPGEPALNVSCPGNDKALRVGVVKDTSTQ